MILHAASSLRRCLAAAFAGILLLLLAAPGCETAPETGRHQLILIGQQTEIDMGLDAYKQTLGNAKVSTDKAANDLVRRVGKRIAAVTPHSADFQWEFTVIDDPKTVNAFCLPGGKVCVYTGILPITQDENGMAVVLGHEISHAVLRHGAERVTQSSILQYALKGGETALAMKMQNKDPDTVNTVMQAFGVGAQYGLEMPFSRKQESEADEVGLYYMADAGYDPAQSIEFWKRMSQMSGSQPPQFLSDHPSHENRVARLEELLPKAQDRYNKSPYKDGKTLPPDPKMGNTTVPAGKPADGGAATPDAGKGQGFDSSKRKTR